MKWNKFIQDSKNIYWSLSFKVLIMPRQQQKQRKVAVIGARSVGKSTLAIRFVDDRFVESYNPTIENTFHKVIKFKGEDIETEIVDTAGQDEYSSEFQRYSVGIQGLILVYSVNSKSSFELIKLINDKLISALGTNTIPRVLVGNKTDLLNDRVITTVEGQALAASWQCPFVECSVKKDENVPLVFNSVLAAIQAHVNPIAERKGNCLIL